MRRLAMLALFPLTILPAIAAEPKARHGQAVRFLREPGQVCQPGREIIQAGRQRCRFRWPRRRHRSNDSIVAQRKLRVVFFRCYRSHLMFHVLPRASLPWGNFFQGKKSSRSKSCRAELLVLLRFFRGSRQKGVIHNPCSFLRSFQLEGKAGTLRPRPRLEVLASPVSTAALGSHPCVALSSAGSCEMVGTEVAPFPSESDKSPCLRERSEPRFFPPRFSCPRACARLDFFPLVSIHFFPKGTSNMVLGMGAEFELLTGAEFELTVKSSCRRDLIAVLR